MSFLLLLISTLQQNWRKTGSAWKWGRERVEARDRGGEITQTMYAHVNK
jgi:hypothetical protein